MNTKAKIVLLTVAIVSLPALIFSLGGGGIPTPTPPDFREIQLKFDYLETHGGLGYELHDLNFVDVKEPTHPFFQNNAGKIDVSKLLDIDYGINNRGAATYYYMQGSNGQFSCMDEDAQNKQDIDPDDPTNNSTISKCHRVYR